MPENKQPQESFPKWQANKADFQLLAQILVSTEEQKTFLMARNVLDTFGNFRQLFNASIKELTDLDEIDHNNAIRIKSALEISRRLLNPQKEPARITSPYEAGQFLMPRMMYLDQEEFHVVLMNTRNKIMGTHMIYRGGVGSLYIRVAEVFRPAIRLNAPAMILAHNHPSGEPEPSQDDIAVTRKLTEMGELLGIQILDHIIIGHNEFVSLQEEGIAFQYNPKTTYLCEITPPTK